MSEIINEDIKVGAIFENTKIQPRWFMWGTRRFDVDKIHYVWSTKQGKELIRHFSVSDGLNVFELSYFTGDSQWILVAVA